MKRILCSLALAILVLSAGYVQVGAFNSVRDVCGNNYAQNSSVCKDTQNINNPSCPSTPLFGPNGIITKIVNYMTVILGIVAVFVILVAGMMYITSGGEASRISTAKNVILFTVIGLVVAALAQILVHFVLFNVGKQSGVPNNTPSSNCTSMILHSPVKKYI